MLRLPPSLTRTATLFPSPTLSRSCGPWGGPEEALRQQFAGRHRDAVHDALDDGLAVDRHGYRLAHPHVLEGVLVGAGDAGARLRKLIHVQVDDAVGQPLGDLKALRLDALEVLQRRIVDRKSTRLNSSH